MSDINKIASESNLNEAWVKALNFASNHAFYFDSVEYDQYSNMLKENLIVLRYELLEGLYTPSPFRSVTIPKPNGETRKIYFTSPKDTLVMMALINGVGHIYENDMYPHSYGYRIAFNEYKNKNAFKKWQVLYANYVNKSRQALSHPSDTFYFISDIRNFYPSIQKEILLQKISLNQTIDNQTYALFEKFINTKSFNNAGQIEIIEGVPTGTAIAPLLANVYLTGFDWSMNQITTNYARYVDDMVFTCDSYESMNTTIDTFNTMLKELNLEPNLSKSLETPISIKTPQKLLEHTSRMHYDWRFESIREISQHDQNEANEIFKEIFLEAENENDIKHIANTSGNIIIKFLERYNSNIDDIQSMCLTFLEKGIVRPETLQSFTSILFNIADRNKKFNLRFQDFFIKNSNDLEKLVFLSILPQFQSLKENEVVLKILDAWLSSDNYLIRGLIYNAIYLLDISNHFPKPNHQDENDYVTSKIILCFPDIIIQDPSLFLSESYLVLFNVLWKIKSSPSMVFDSSDIIRAINRLASNLELKLICQKILLEKKDDEWKLIYKTIPDRIRNLILKSIVTDLSPDDSHLIITSIKSEYDDLDMLDEGISVSDLISNLSIEPLKLEEIFGNDYTIMNYGHLSVQDNSYRCQIIKYNNGYKATIEYIHKDRILSHFDSIDMWDKYLEDLQSKNIISIKKKGLHTHDIFFCIYNIGIDSHQLSEIIENVSYYDNYDILRVISSISKSIEVTENAHFRFDGIIPHNIILSQSDGTCKFLNIGFGLKSPNHNCTQSNCKHYQLKLELGPTTGLYFLGLTIVEMVLKQCPVEEIKKIKQRSENNTIINLLEKLGDEPHLRTIMQRLLQEDAMLRYQNVANLIEDVNHVIKYRNNLKDLPDEKQNIYTLVDYIFFRYSILLRHPETRNSTTVLQSSIHIIENLSRSVYHLESKYKNILFQKIQATTYLKIIKLGIPLRKLSPQTRFLIRLCLAWSETCEEIKPYISLDNYPIDKLIIIYILFMELSSYVKTLSLTTNDFVELSPTQNNNIIFYNEDGMNIKTAYTDETIHQYLEFTRYIQDNSQFLEKYVTTLSSLTGFIVFNKFELSQDNHGKLTVKQPIDFVLLDNLINIPGNWENSIDINSTQSNMLQQADWDDFANLINALENTVQIKRRIGILNTYNSVQKQGSVRIRHWLIHHQKYEFNIPSVWVWGNMTKLEKKRRIVAIDLVEKNSKTKIATILSRPNLFSDLLPLKNNSILTFLNKPVVRFLVVAILFMLLTFIFSKDLILSSFSSSILSVIVNVFSTPIIQRFIYPENSKDI